MKNVLSKIYIKEQLSSPSDSSLELESLLSFFSSTNSLYLKFYHGDVNIRKKIKENFFIQNQYLYFVMKRVQATYMSRRLTYFPFKFWFLSLSLAITSLRWASRAAAASLRSSLSALSFNLSYNLTLIFSLV